MNQQGGGRIDIPLPESAKTIPIVINNYGYQDVAPTTNGTMTYARIIPDTGKYLRIPGNTDYVIEGYSYYVTGDNIIQSSIDTGGYGITKEDVANVIKTMLPNLENGDYNMIISDLNGNTLNGYRWIMASNLSAVNLDVVIDFNVNNSNITIRNSGNLTILCPRNIEGRIVPSYLIKYY